MNVSEIKNRVAVINSQVSKLNNERNVSIGKLETLKSQLENAISNYKAKYGVDITDANISDEVTKVSDEVTKKADTIQNILNAINEGNYELANQLAGVEPNKEEVKEEKANVVENHTTTVDVEPTAPVAPVTPTTPISETVAPPVAPVTPLVTPTTPVSETVAPPVAPVAPPVTPVSESVAPPVVPTTPITPPVAPITPPVEDVAPPVAPPTGSLTNLDDLINGNVGETSEAPQLESLAESNVSNNVTSFNAIISGSAFAND